MDKPFEESWFHAPGLALGQAAALSAEDSHHLRDVLRLKPGRPIVASDGKGQVFLCATRFGRSDVEVTALERIAWEPEPPRLNLVLGLLKGRDLEEPVEGLCQLPAASIQLVLTDHGREFKGQDHGRLMERLRTKSRVALKQAKKPWLTLVHEPLPLREWPRPDGPLILVHPGPDSLPARPAGAFHLLIGPEGGFSLAELDWLAHQENCATLGLGNTRIRGTLAPLLACGKLMGLGWF